MQCMIMCSILFFAISTKPGMNVRSADVLYINDLTLYSTLLQGCNVVVYDHKMLFTSLQIVYLPNCFFLYITTYVDVPYVCQP